MRRLWNVWRRIRLAWRVVRSRSDRVTVTVVGLYGSEIIYDVAGPLMQVVRHHRGESRHLLRNVSVEEMQAAYGRLYSVLRLKKPPSPPLKKGATKSKRKARR